MRRYRRNADDRFRRIERAFRAGDPSAFAPYVMALRSSRGHGQWALAARLVRTAMVTSGEWYPWPTFNDEIMSFEQARLENEDNFWLASVHDEPIAAPMLGVERMNDVGDIETEWYTDGPYVVKVDPYDPEYITRQFDFGEAPPGSRSFIPLWRVSEVHPPPFGIGQRGYDHVSQGHGRGFQGTVDVESMVVHVDGVSISENPDRSWRVEGEEFLCSARGMLLAGLRRGP